MGYLQEGHEKLEVRVLKIVGVEKMRTRRYRERKSANNIDTEDNG